MQKESRTVLVTGAAGGVGCELVARFGDLGWRVYAGVRPGGTAASRAGGSVVPVELDITDPASIAAAPVGLRDRLIRDSIGLNRRTSTAAPEPAA